VEKTTKISEVREKQRTERLPENKRKTGNNRRKTDKRSQDLKNLNMTEKIQGRTD
jgi:hypothetical protein